MNTTTLSFLLIHINKEEKKRDRKCTCWCECMSEGINSSPVMFLATFTLQGWKVTDLLLSGKPLLSELGFQFRPKMSTSASTVWGSSGMPEFSQMCFTWTFFDHSRFNLGICSRKFTHDSLSEDHWYRTVASDGDLVRPWLYMDKSIRKSDHYTSRDFNKISFKYSDSNSLNIVLYWK